MPCTKPVPVTSESGLINWFECGSCLYCRKKRSRQWSLRLSMELVSFNYKAVFVTLTYDDKHCPTSLVRSDIQKFFKRLRKDLSLENRKIKRTHKNANYP